MANGNGSTAWKLATGALTVFVVCAGSMWGMITVHADHPHKDSLSRDEFEMSHTSIERRLSRIEDKLDTILAR